jgi:hypothetical protein
MGHPEIQNQTKGESKGGPPAKTNHGSSRIYARRIFTFLTHLRQVLINAVTGHLEL